MSLFYKPSDEGLPDRQNGGYNQYSYSHVKLDSPQPNNSRTRLVCRKPHDTDEKVQ
jgi:hypothetical protein